MSTHLTAHLTKEELTDNLLGVSSLTVNAHLLSCPACTDELERVKNSIAGFRSAARAWSEDALVKSESRASQVGVFGERASSARWPARWILASAVLILLVAGSLAYLHQERTTSQARSVEVSTPMVNAGLSQAQLDQDNQLLSQVSGELSEAVPAPMQPLLVSESSGSNSVTNK
jgi:predicted anti-sigma-YlaC factor YlaD